MGRVRVGLIGSGFIGDIHAAAFKMVPDAEVVAVASPTPGKAKAFARARGIPKAFEDYRDLLALKQVDMVTLGVPNYLHAEVAVAPAVRFYVAGTFNAEENSVRDQLAKLLAALGG